MEGFFNLIDKFMQSMIWRTFISHFQWIDWFTGALLLVGLIYGMKRGLMRELVEILECVLLIFVVLYFQKKLSFFLNLKMGLLEVSAKPVAFIGLAIPVWWVIHWIDHQLNKMMHSKMAGPIRVLGGGVLGIVHVLLLWSFISQAVMMIPIQVVQKVYEGKNSYSGPILAQLAPAVYENISQPFHKIKKQKSETQPA